MAQNPVEIVIELMVALLILGVGFDIILELLKQSEVSPIFQIFILGGLAAATLATIASAIQSLRG